MGPPLGAHRAGALALPRRAPQPRAPRLAPRVPRPPRRSNLHPLLRRPAGLLLRLHHGDLRRPPRSRRPPRHCQPRQRPLALRPARRARRQPPFPLRRHTPPLRQRRIHGAKSPRATRRALPPAQPACRAPTCRARRRDRPAAAVRPAAPGKTHGARPPHFPLPLRNFASCVPTHDRYRPAHSPT